MSRIHSLIAAGLVVVGLSAVAQVVALAAGDLARLDVPACPHDPTRWHGLVERNPDGSIQCAYDHEHKDDPRTLDYKFKPLTWELDYPWHAFNTRTGNPEDHRTFNWGVIDSVPCKPANTDLGFTSLRVETHAGYNGATLRFHSYYLQAETCDPADPGYRGTVSLGGWLDFGYLHVVQDAARGGEIIVPLPDQDTLIAPVKNTTMRRAHGSDSFTRELTWYGNNSLIAQAGQTSVYCNLGIGKEDWGYIDPADPLTRHFYGGSFNGSWKDPAHIVIVQIPASLAAKNGFVDWSGYLDRWGNLVSGCTSPGLDCVPATFSHVKPGFYQFRSDVQGMPIREYDVKIGDGSPIVYPN